MFPAAPINYFIYLIQNVNGRNVTTLVYDLDFILLYIYLYNVDRTKFSKFYRKRILMSPQ